MWTEESLQVQLGKHGQVGVGHHHPTCLVSWKGEKSHVEGERETGVMLPRLGHLKLDKERWTLPQGSRRGTALPTPRFRTLASKTERQ